MFLEEKCLPNIHISHCSRYPGKFNKLQTICHFPFNPPQWFPSFIFAFRIQLHKR